MRHPGPLIKPAQATASSSRRISSAILDSPPEIMSLAISALGNVYAAITSALVASSESAVRTLVPVAYTVYLHLCVSEHDRCVQSVFEIIIQATTENNSA